MTDAQFINQNVCQRCGQTPLRIKTLSWFTEEVLCMDCVRKEDAIKRALRAQGKSDMEGCGYVPTV